MNWYSPVLFDLNLLCIIIFVLLPVLSVLLVVFIKRKFLWAAPIISTILMVVISLIATGPSLLAVREYRRMFLGIIVLIQFIVASGFTLVAYAAEYMFKSKKK